MVKNLYHLVRGSRRKAEKKTDGDMLPRLALSRRDQDHEFRAQRDEFKKVRQLADKVVRRVAFPTKNSKTAEPAPARPSSPPATPECCNGVHP